MATVGQALRQGKESLAAASETPALDAQTLLADLLARPRGWLLTHPEQELAPAIWRAFQERLARCAAGEPLPYVLGWWEFYKRRFAVGPAVLIPRPETELLVERALAWLGRRGRPCRALDVGTGSGCIAVTLACERPELQVLAADRSMEALRLARRNARRHGVQGYLSWVQADLAGGLRGPFDLLCANLPYIPSAELAGLKVARFEPRLALDGGPDGMAFVGPMIDTLPRLLAAPGLALLEVGPQMSRRAQARARALGPGWRVGVELDLAGRERLLWIERLGRAG